MIPELTEKEDLIRGYLERDEALPVDIIDSVLSQLWTAEPFKSKGFILDGFPNNETELNILNFTPNYIPLEFLSQLFYFVTISSLNVQ